jgi:ribosome-associated protein
MPGPIVVRDNVVVPENELRWRFSRSSGPGGQSVNTTDSRVELSLDIVASTAFDASQRQRALDRLGHRLTDGILTIAASEYRSQLRNREAAQRRMTQVLRDAIAPPPPKRRPTRPTQGVVRRRLERKRQRGETKQQRRQPDG